LPKTLATASQFQKQKMTNFRTALRLWEVGLGIINPALVAGPKAVKRRLLLDKWRKDPADRQHMAAVAQAEAAYNAARERWERAYLAEEAWEEQRQAARERGEIAVQMVMIEEVG
jgi:hypothetical protein